jgi:hypothetical protein
MPRIKRKEMKGSIADSVSSAYPVMSIAGKLGKTSVEMFAIGCKFSSDVSWIRGLNCMQGYDADMSIVFDTQGTLEK